MTIVNISGTDVEETQIGNVTQYFWDTIKIYRIPAQSYVGHATNMYLLLNGEATLIDVALDTEQARTDLEDGIRTINEDFRESIGVEDISGVLISHGHIDHWGMLSNSRFAGKKVYIHELDTMFLQDIRSRRANHKTRMGEFVAEAGWSLSTDDMFSLDGIIADPQPIDLITVEDGQTILEGCEVYHVPGHSPGHICLQVGPVLFLGDHILSKTTPLQMPNSMLEGCGVRSYIDSLRKVASLGNHMGLPGHEDTIYSVKARVEEIEVFHYQRLLDILEVCQQEKNLSRITDEYYQLRPETIQGKPLADLPRDEQILALEEIKAHLEYLIEDGRISITGIMDGVVMYHAK